jgi:hypothetical protein
MCYAFLVAAMGTRRHVHFFSRQIPIPRSTTALNPLECALATKHRVLPVFSRNRPQLTALDATLTRISISVHSKGFAEKLTPLDATLTKKAGWGPLP